jgi:hypothetical protein
VEQIGVHGEAVDLERDFFGNFAREDGGFERELLLGADSDIVARDDAAGLEDLGEAVGDFALAASMP